MLISNLQKEAANLQKGSATAPVVKVEGEKQAASRANSEALTSIRQAKRALVLSIHKARLCKRLATNNTG